MRGLAGLVATRQGQAALLTSGPRCAAGGLGKVLDKCNEALEKLENLKSSRQGPGTSGEARAAGPELNIYLGHQRSQEGEGRGSGWEGKICA